MSKPSFDPNKPFTVVDESKPAFDPSKPFTVVDEPSPDSMNDHFVGATRAVLFGARPFVAGVGGGIGAAAQRLEDPNLDFQQKLAALPEAWKKGFASERAGAIAEEADLARRRPMLSFGYDVGGAVLTAPLMAAKGATALSRVGSAALKGAAAGGAEALGHADSLKGAATSITLGGVLGGTLQGIGEALPAVTKLARKGASNLTGVSEKEIATYASRADEVKDMMSKAGGDISQAADQLRQSIVRDIQNTRKSLNNQISSALSDVKYQGVTVDGSRVLSSIDDSISKIGKATAEFRPEEVARLSSLKEKVQKFIGSDGKILIQDLNAVKQELQRAAESSYDAINKTVIFPSGELTARAAKGAAAEAKKILDQAVPGIVKPNQQLSRLHAIEDSINKNLLRAGKPEAALLGAGSGANPRNLRMLENIDKLTGSSAARGAENLAAARTFDNIPLLPTDFTGKAALRTATGFGLGYAAGGDAQSGLYGAALSSPSALKIALETARISRVAAKGLGVDRAARAIAPTAGTATRTLLQRKLDEMNRGK